VSEGRHYRFGPLERRGVLAGWRGGQIAAVGSTLLAAVLVLAARADPFGAGVAVVLVASGVGVACWPVSGRTAEEWLPTVVRWLRDGVGARHLELSPAPGRGAVAGLRGHVEMAPRDRCRDRGREGIFGGLSIEPAVVPAGRESGPAPLGVLRDRHARTLSAVLVVSGRSFTLLGAEEKDARVSGWAATLAALARERTAVHRVQWVARSMPDDGVGARIHLQERAVLDHDHPAHRSYRGVLASAGSSANRHEVLLALQVSEERRGWGRRVHRPSTRGGAVATLWREMEALGRQLSDADLTVRPPLDAADLAGAVARGMQLTPTGDSPVSGGRGRDPWPMAVEAEWGRVHTDETWHAVYWIAEWPRTEVGADFLGPLLLSPGRRTVSVVMEPLSPGDAVRQVERARTADAADSELRRRGGFLATARRSREQELVVRRELELADGHASFRFSGYVAVTAASPTDLEDACQATEQAAGQSRLELRRLYGDQSRAFACTLPLCRGLS
jgi:hypothetical protein